MPIKQKLRPYQEEVGRAVLESVLNRRGLTFTVEMARQGGKNELSAQLELLLLTLGMARGATLVKAAPTFAPQCLISLRRLTERLDDAGFRGSWSREGAHVIRLGRARQLFLSAEPTANVVGMTADPLLEVDEAQEVDGEKFWKEFRPMGAATNATTVLYGTPWDGASLLEEVKGANLEAERKDGVRRHFSFDWEVVAACNPLYRRYVEAERARLGEEHPLFRTQYLLLPIAGRGGLFSPQQLAGMQGSHPRQHAPAPGGVYVAGLDVAGGGGASTNSIQEVSAGSARDATVLTIGELDFSTCSEVLPEPGIKVVEHYHWQDVPHSQLLPHLSDVLKGRWACRRVAVDATGMGHTVASLLERALGKAVVTPFTFTAQSKSLLGYELMAAVNTGRVRMYARDGSGDWGEFWREMQSARALYGTNRRLNFYVEESAGHDDYLTSLALLVEAARYLPRVARGRRRETLAEASSAAAGWG